MVAFVEDSKSFELTCATYHLVAVGAKLALHTFTLKTKEGANPGKG